MDGIGKGIDVINCDFRWDDVAYFIEKSDMVFRQRMATAIDAFVLNSLHPLSEDG
jgi:hypothetical protein